MCGVVCKQTRKRCVRRIWWIFPRSGYITWLSTCLRFEQAIWPLFALHSTHLWLAFHYMKRTGHCGIIGRCQYQWNDFFLTGQQFVHMIQVGFREKNTLFALGIKAIQIFKSKVNIYSKLYVYPLNI